MMSAPPTTWLVRCEGGALYDEFIEKGLVALGSVPPEPDLSGCASSEDVRATLAAATDCPKRNLSYATRVLATLAVRMQQGDRMLTYDPSSRRYRVGTVTSGYQYELNTLSGKQHFRRVDWNETIQRDHLSVSSRGSLSQQASAFPLNDSVAGEVDSLIRREPPKKRDVGENDEEPIQENMALQARELVKDRVAALDWESMQHLVAGVLRAMGYKTRVSPRGPDRGRDIVASPDGLGLEEPRIVVEVKHRRDQIGAPAVRSFVGGL